MEFIELGKVVGVWGVKGWIKLHSYSRERIGIADYATWYLSAPKASSQKIPYKVLNCRTQGQGIVAQFETINDRDAAVNLNGYKIWVAVQDLPNLEEGEFYWHQLIGLEVKNKDNLIGWVKSVMETGANDVLVCRSVQQDKEEILIPYTKDRVLSIDLEKAEMVVDWDPDYL